MKLKLFLLLFCCFIAKAQSQSRIGINTDNPQGTLHVTRETKDDVLILSDMKTAGESINSIDVESTSYLNLQISENGVLRREVPESPTQSAIIDLASNITIPSTAATAARLIWHKSPTLNSEFITVSDAGTYIFSFRLYANFSSLTSVKNGGGLYIISSYKDGSTTPLSQDAIYLVAKGTPSGTVVTYTYNSTITASAGDKIYFTIYRNTDLGIGTNIGLILRATPGNNANKTSLLYWKIPAY